MADLEQFISSLDTDQIRQLVAIMKDKRFELNKDIVGNLPVELVLLVFSYLDPIAPFLYQCVCKRWQRVLSSETVLEDSLSLWYSPKDPPLIGEISGHRKTEHERLYVRLEHMQRFRTGRPSGTVKMFSNDGLEKSGSMSLNSTHLAWVDDTRRVLILNLQTGESFCHSTPGRTGVADLKLSEDLLLIEHHLRSTPCIFEVLELRTKQTYNIRLPSNDVSRSDVRARTIAFLMGGSSIIVWDVDSKRTRTFGVPLCPLTTCSSIGIREPCPMHISGLNLFNDGRSILVIRYGNVYNDGILGFEEYTIDGKLLGRRDVIPVSAARNMELKDAIGHDCRTNPEGESEGAFKSWYLSNVEAHHTSFDDRIELELRVETDVSYTPDQYFAYDCTDMRLSDTSKETIVVESVKKDYWTHIRWKGSDILCKGGKAFTIQSTINGKMTKYDYSESETKNRATGIGNDRFLVLIDEDAVMLHSFDPDFNVALLDAVKAS